jgi:hypothetical protein
MWPSSLKLPQHTDELLAVGAAFRAYPGITVSLSPGEARWGLALRHTQSRVSQLKLIALACAGSYVTPGNGSFVVDNAIAQMYRVTAVSQHAMRAEWAHVQARPHLHVSAWPQAALTAGIACGSQ